MRFIISFILSTVFLSGFAMAGDLDQAPPAFGTRSGTAVPVDISSVDIDIDFDYASRQAKCVATVRFTNTAAGFPLMDLVPSVLGLTYDGNELGVDQFPVISDPDGVTKYRVLRVESAPGDHVLEVHYNLDSDDVSFSSGRVRAGFFMSDLTTGGRKFFEQYGPSNIEFDQIEYKFNVKVTGASKEHVIYTNGDITSKGDEFWSVEFPDYFTTSSLYFHISEKDRFYENQFVIEGHDADIPVIIYATSSSRVSDATRRTKTIIAELEDTYGAMIHKKLVIYVTADGGGMEYGGATMTSMGALGHELTHSWFARGVMPSKGNSGWIDEATASWRDRGYYRARGAPSRSSVNLGGFSLYRRHTTRDAYTLGRQLMSEFDYMFREDGGMRSVLKVLYTEYAGETIDVDIFKSLVERVSGMDLTAIFDRYVFGGRTAQNGFSVLAPERFGSTEKIDHPLPYSEAEIKLYR